MSKVHWSFWVIGIIALIWNLLGVMNFIGQLDPEYVGTLPASHKELIEGRPIWATASFAIAVFAGSLGCILLLLRRRICIAIFSISFLAVIAQLIPSLAILASGTYFSIAEISLAFAMPAIVAAFLIWYSSHAQKNNWLR